MKKRMCKLVLIISTAHIFSRSKSPHQIFLFVGKYSTSDGLDLVHSRRRVRLRFLQTGWGHKTDRVSRDDAEKDVKCQQSWQEVLEAKGAQGEGQEMEEK